jgi:hypothetical protein
MEVAAVSFPHRSDNALELHQAQRIYRKQQQMEEQHGREVIQHGREVIDISLPDKKQVADYSCNTQWYHRAHAEDCQNSR